MPLSPFTNFLIAAITASSAFIGLLFVALSFITQSADKTPDTLSSRERLLAEGSYSALVNVFFVSLIALIPGAGLAWASLAMSTFGISTLVDIARKTPFNSRAAAAAESISTLTFIFALYIVQLAYAIVLIKNPASASATYVLISLLAALFGAALVRAWQLVGVRQGK